MPNESTRKILEQLKLNADRETMRHEIEEMLNQELAKPEEEIDAALVEELLDLLDAPVPTAEEKEAAWTAVERSLTKPRKANWRTVLLRCTAAAAAVVVLFYLTVQTAEALRWTFLLRLLRPVAETFGLYSASNLDYEDPYVSDETDYTDADTEYGQVMYSSLEEMPAEISGVRIAPAWMVEEYAFVQGSVYQDPDLANTCLVYQSGEQYLCLSTMIFLNENAVSGYEFEQSLQKVGSEPIADQNVTLYRNSSGQLQCYAWISGNVHYTITGEVSLEDLEKIIRGLMP